MSGGKLTKTSIGKILLRTLPFLLGIAIIVVGSVSYAKYVSSHAIDDSASTAGMGIEIFELDKYGSQETNVDYTQIVPGADIPGPHIKLRINSEVSYTLYVKVTETGFPVPVEADKENKNSLYYSTRNAIVGNIKDKDGNTTPHEVISYDMSSRWAWVATELGEINGVKYCTKTYKYNVVGDVSESTVSSDYIFKPTTKYNYTDVDVKDYTTLKELQLLANDSIFISQYYGDYVYGDYERDENGKPKLDANGNLVYEEGVYQQTQKFSLSFKAYIKQVLN